jgi:hypothetical protein
MSIGDHKKKMQTLRVCGRDAWIELMPVERFAHERDARPELSLCFARVSTAQHGDMWVTNGELIKGQAVDVNGAPVDHWGHFSHRHPPLLMDAFLCVKGLPNKRNSNFQAPEWPRHMSLETLEHIEGAPTPQLGVVLRIAFPTPPAAAPGISARFDPRAHVRAAGAPAFVEFAFSLFSAP